MCKYVRSGCLKSHLQKLVRYGVSVRHCLCGESFLHLQCRKTEPAVDIGEVLVTLGR